MPFARVIGHARMLSLVARAVAQETLPPSLLLAGPPGVGKRRIALAIAEALNCVSPVRGGIVDIDACGDCAACRRIARGVHPDVLVVEPGDTGAIKIEQVREVIDKAGYRPFEGRRRVVIVDEADALVPAAQNALLKTLEEPPSGTVFILVSSMPDALLATVRSRCPRLRVGALSTAEIADALVRDHGYDAADAHAAAVDADGSLGRALQAQAVDVRDVRQSAQRLLVQLTQVQDPSRRLELVKDLIGKSSSASEREQLAVFLRVLGSLLRDVSLLAAGGTTVQLANADLEAELTRVSRSIDADRGSRGYAAVDQALAALDRNASPKVVADWLSLQL